MSTLKQLRLRINGVKSTEKITKAMKMVSASKLSKAQEAKDHLKPYANKMYNVVAHLAGSVSKESDLSPLLIGNGRDNIHLLVVISSDKGLCGNFNSCIVKTVKQHINSLQVEGKECKILCLGKKAYEQLKHHYNKHIIGVSPGFNKAIYDEANKLADKLMDLFKNHELIRKESFAFDCFFTMDLDFVSFVFD